MESNEELSETLFPDLKLRGTTLLPWKPNWPLLRFWISITPTSLISHSFPSLESTFWVDPLFPCAGKEKVLVSLSKSDECSCFFFWEVGHLIFSKKRKVIWLPFYPVSSPLQYMKYNDVTMYSCYGTKDAWRHQSTWIRTRNHPWRLLYRSRTKYLPWKWFRRERWQRASPLVWGRRTIGLEVSFRGLDLRVNYVDNNFSHA